MIALRVLPPSWKTFRQGVFARSKLPKLPQLKADCIQEKSMLMSQDDTSIGCDVQGLTTQVDKKKKPKFKRKRKHMDYSKIQCFRCDNFGHLASHCPERLKHQASFAKVSNPVIDLERFLF